MPTETETSFMGPALFIGLTLFMLITGKPVERELNPRLEMDLLAAQTEHSPAKIAARQPTSRAPIAARPQLATAEAVAVPAREAWMTVPLALPAIRSVQLDPALAAPTSVGYAPEFTSASDRSARTHAHWLALPHRADPLPEPPEHARETRTERSTAPHPRRALRPVSLPRLSEASAPPAAASLPKATVSGDAVHLRAHPSAQSDILTRLFTGQQARLVGRSGNWARLYLPEATPPLTGWIYRDYISGP